MSSSVHEQEARHSRISCTVACHVSREHHVGPQLPRPRHHPPSTPESVGRRQGITQARSSEPRVVEVKKVSVDKHAGHGRDNVGT